MSSEVGVSGLATVSLPMEKGASNEMIEEYSASAAFVAIAGDFGFPTKTSIWGGATRFITSEPVRFSAYGISTEKPWRRVRSLAASSVPICCQPSSFPELNSSSGLDFLSIPNFLTRRSSILPLLSFFDVLAGYDDTGSEEGITAGFEDLEGSAGVAGKEVVFRSCGPGKIVSTAGGRRLLSLRGIWTTKLGGALRLIADVDCDRGEGMIVFRRSWVDKLARLERVYNT